MKRILAMATVGAAAVFMSGCEWSGGGSDSGWSTTGISSDVSGTYQDASGGSGGGDVNASEGYGTGNGVSKNYTHTLDNAPVVKGSVLVSGGGGESFSDNGSGGMVGSSGGSGNINYNTGAMSITYTVPPSGGLNVTYQYEGAGSTSALFPFTVQQNGNKVRLVTRRGDVLEGSLGVAETATVVSGSSTNTVATVYQFSASGTSGGKGVNMTGVFQTAAGTMEATWVEDGGATGSINAKRQ